MGEQMNQVKKATLITAPLTLLTLTATLALAAACSSGGEDPDDDNGGSDSGGSAGNGTSGTTVVPGGSSSTSGNATGGSGTSGSGTSGSATGGSAPTGPSVCDDATFALPAEEAYVDNFEDMVRFAGWYAFSDTTPPNMPAPARVEEGALETGWSGHVGATGIKASTAMGYGAGFGFGLVDPAKGACVDLSAFAGISFWAKGTAGASNVLKFQIVAPATQPTTEMPVGDCATAACAFKHPAKEITLTAEWQQFVINFADLAPAAAYTGKVLGFNMITDGPDYDVNIDEVTFFETAAPEGPVMPPAAM
jgi:hypothetical protein